MYRYVRKYTGTLKACILDWSGTTADKYVLAPAVVFQDVFHKYGVPITMAEARLPMGLRKDLRIAEILEMPRVAKRWALKHGAAPNEKDVERIFADFLPLELACLPVYSKLIPGTTKAVHELRHKHKLKIGMTTGFTRDMVDVLLHETRLQGYSPDCVVAGDEVIHGSRPSPFMLYKNLDILGICPIQSVVKVDDTTGGIGEGLSAGCWTIGLSRFSNYMDIDSLDHERRLSIEELEERNIKSREILQNAGAHFVVDSIAEVPAVVEHINKQLRLGIMP